MTIDLFILLLVAFMLVAGLIAVEAKDLLSSVIALGAAGSALSVIDLLLGAPDLAFPQVVVEVITVVLLIRMIMTRRDTAAETPRDTLRTAVVLTAGGMFLVAVYLAAGGVSQEGAMPPFGQPVLANDLPAYGPAAGEPAGASAGYLTSFLRDTQAANCVMTIVLDYRGYDTLGEATVLFVSILGAITILRVKGWARAGRQR